jgi:hypothetical protein
MSLFILNKMLSGPPSTEFVKSTADSNCLETSLLEWLIRSVCWTVHISIHICLIPDC